MKILRYCFFLPALFFLMTPIAFSDPLPSWNETPNKHQLLEFIQSVSNPDSPQYVPANERIATFDNDGTLWVEQPVYTQIIFAFDRIKALAPQHPEWKKQAPFNAILSGDQKALAQFTLQDFQKVLTVTDTGMTVDVFQTIVSDWLKQAKNRHFNKPYTQLVYRPMLELMAYLRQNQFKVYIVTGGGQAFVRAFSESIYQVPLEQVIGTAGKVAYSIHNREPQLLKLPQLLFIDDKQGKPEAIQLFIGRKPLLAFGNSDGDRQMLEWTASRPRAHWMGLVHHDDAKREYAYDKNSKIGTFSTDLMQEAQAKHWAVISMEKDWKVIF